MEMLTEISTSSDRIFRNKIIVKNIIEKLEIEEESFQHLNLRLITKIFNTEYISLIKKTFQNLKIDLIFDWKDDKTKVTINKQFIQEKEIQKCLKFLRNVAKIDVKSARFTGDTDFINTSKMHKLIFESLILTNEEPVRILTSELDFCSATETQNECIPCRQLAPLCQEYGPMTMDVLLNAISVPHHFEKLKITDFLLQKIGSHSTQQSESKEECLSIMKTMINSNITCDNLHIPLYVMDWNMGNIKHAQPREILNEILEQWKVKSITIKFIKNRYKNVSRSWSRPPKRFLTRFHFGMLPSDFEVSENNYVEHVVVDARWSEAEYDNPEYWMEPYLHLFSNLIRIFPFSKDIFVIRELKKDVRLMLDEILRNLVKYAWDECPENNRSELFIRLKYSEIVLHSEKEDDIPEIDGNFINGFQLLHASTEISQKFENWRNVIEDYNPDDIRQCFSLKNHMNNRELHFELIHTESTLTMAKQNVCTPFQIMFYYQFFNSL